MCVCIDLDSEQYISEQRKSGRMVRTNGLATLLTEQKNWKYAWNDMFYKQLYMQIVGLL